MLPAMRVCIVYDCLYPYTIGGGERWYRNLAEHLADAGHEVTYVTLRQWPRGERLDLDERVRVVTAGPRMALYTASGRRRILPPLVFGLGVLWHLLRHGRRYDVVHTCAFPYFSLLSAALVRPLRGYALEVDWFEVWSERYWRDYLGGLGGRIGELVQRLCARVAQRAFCFSELHARAAARGGAERLGDRAAGAVCRVAAGAGAGAGAGAVTRIAVLERPVRALRRSPDRGEAGDARRRGDRACERSDRRPARRVPRRRPRARGAAAGDRRSRPAADRLGAGLRRRGDGRPGDAQRDVRAAALAPGGLRAGRRRGGRARHAVAWSWRARTTRRRS